MLSEISKRQAESTSKDVSLLELNISDDERLGIKKELYDKYAKEYEKRTDEAHYLYQREMARFSRLAKSSKIVDLGSGPGIYAQELKKYGLDPLCCDFSPEMLKLCILRGLEVRLMNYEQEMDIFEDESLGGLWTNCSLTTTPKNKVQEILKEIHRKLIPGAPVFFGFIESENENEGWIDSDWKYRLLRFRFRSNRDNIGKMLRENGFKIDAFTEISREKCGKNDYVNFICTKNGSS